MDIAWRLIFCISTGALILLLHGWIGGYPDPFPRSDEPRKEIRDVLLIWSLGVIFPILRLFAINPWLNGIFGSRFFQELVFAPFLAVVYIVIPVYIVMRRSRWSATDFGINWKTRSPAVAIFAVSLGLISGFTAFISSQAVVSSDPISAGTLVLLLFNNDFIEEFFHRGIIQSKLERAIGQKGAIILGGVLFGLTHIAFDIKMLLETGVIFIIFAFILQMMLGWMLGIIYMKTRSLWPGVACHYLVNWLPSILVGIFG